jgi:hypothetical protein
MALIDTIAEAKQHNSALAANMQMTSVQSFLDEAINRHIIPAIGYSQYEELLAAKAAAPTDKQKRVINLLQKSLTGFMVYYWADQGAVKFSDQGIHVSKSESNLPASDKKIMALKKQNVFSGYNNLELAVSFLEENLNNFPLYKDSNEHQNNRALLINTSSEFQTSGINIGNDARLYATLRIYQSDIESTYIEPLLGTTIKDALHTAILNGSLGDTYKALLKRVQKAIAFYTIAEAIPYMAITLDPSGIFELSETVGGISGNVENRASASDRKLAVAMNGYLQKAEQQIEVIRKYLKANAADFKYITPEVVEINDPNNNVYFI